MFFSFIRSTASTFIRMLYSGDGREAGRAEAGASLRNRPMTRDGVFLYVDVTDEKGVVLASSSEDRVGTSVGDSPAFKLALSGKDAVGAALPGPNANALVPFAVPVTLDGKTRGVLMAMVDFARLGEKFVAPIRIGKQGYAFVATGVGEIMIHPDKSEIMVPVAPTSLTPKMVKWRNGIYEYSWSGQDWIALYETDEQSNWTVIVKAQGGEVFAEIHDIAKSTIILTIGASVVFSVMLFLVVHYLIASLRRTVAFAEAVPRESLIARWISDPAMRWECWLRRSAIW